MKLKDIFSKPVDRKIEGVIKADDDEGLRTEVEEYVLTNEIERRLEQFLDAYNNYANANGVWISGFFGSGKSHLLKMMALLLANREIEGNAVFDSFKEKCEDNKLLLAALQKAVSIPSESILFNIDQKADVISKDQVDALLSVFVKVFDEHCGYYGKQAYIAQFERKLDEDGLLDDFKAAFARHEGESWHWGCERINRVSSSIDAAFQDVTGEQVDKVINKFRSDYKLSIEDFAEQVNAYLRRKPKNFRLNFFVDEVGQYIAENTKLMTNLQTVAESLATRCDGQAWVIVTAQADMIAVIGEMGKQQSNDFSKIKDRFAIRMKLTSADVAEVIQKRLLKKTETGEGELEVLYDREHNNFKTLLNFEGGLQYKNYQDKDHFVDCYPFIPYQFDLFQLAIQNLSKHNAFEGKHSSVGERSMLGVFQEVAKAIANHELGEIATFDLMFEGIRSALKGPTQHSIHLAERLVDNQLAVRLLKALFLVKYVQEFKTTSRNLCVLMLDHFDQDIPELKKRVEEALNLLVNQVYIQRTGDIYEFLTDEEKDVEQEIKNTEVDAKDVAEELSKIVFDKLIKSKKIRFDDNKQDFPFTRKLDDRAFSREQELAVHVISPFHENAENHDQLKMMYMGKPELLVVLPADDRMMIDLLQYKKTDKYVSQNISLTQKDSIKRILSEKQIANQHRITESTRNIGELLGQARLFVAGGEVESGSQDPVTRVADGFNQLIVQTYPNLKMLRGISYTEDKIEHYLKNDEGLFDKEQTSEAEMEVLAFVTRRLNPPNNLRTSLKDLTDSFEKKPFGWPLPAIMCFVAQLVNRGKIQVKGDSETLEGSKLVSALKNTRNHANYLVEPQVMVPPGRIRKLKEFYEHFFDTPAKGTDQRTLGPELADAFAKLHSEISNLLKDSHQYPFLHDLVEPNSQIETHSLKKSYFSDEFEGQLEQLLDLKEETLDPIRNFMAGSQARLYAEARQFLYVQSANFSYIDGDEIQQLENTLSDPKCYLGRGMQNVKTWLDSVQTKIDERLDSDRVAVELSIKKKADHIHSMPEYQGLKPEQKSEIQAVFDRVAANVESQDLLAVVHDSADRFEKQMFPQLLSKVHNWSAPQGDGVGGTKVEVQIVNNRTLTVDFGQAVLTDETDVDNYLFALKSSMMNAINDGKRIQI